MAVTQLELQTLANSVAVAMGNLQNRIEARVLAETLPVLGNGLAAAAAAGEQVLNAVDTLGGILSSTLATLSSSARTDAAVQNALQLAINRSTVAEFANTIVTVSRSPAGELLISLQTGVTDSFTQAVAGDLGLPGLQIDAGGTATVEASMTLDLAFGTTVSGQNFVFHSTSPAEAEIDLAVSGLVLDATADMAGQGYVVADGGTGFTATIGVDVQDADNRLTAGQLATATIAASLDGAANIAVDMTVADQGDMTPPISTTLAVDWQFNGAVINPSDANISFGDRPEIAFNGVTMDLATFMEDMVSPLMTRINDMIEPIRPLIDILTTSIRFIEDLPGDVGMILDATGDGRINLLDLLQIAFPGANLDGFVTFVEIADDILDWSEFLSSTVFADGTVNLGSFDFGNADIRAAGFDLQQALASFGGLADNLNSVVAGLTGAGWTASSSAGGMTGRDILQELLGSSIFDLPVLTDPAQWMQLFQGNDVDLVMVDLPSVIIGTDTTTPPGGPLDTIDLARIPVIPFIFLEFGFGMQARFDLDFGFNTRGLTDPSLNAIDGFFMVDQPLQEILLRSTFTAGIAADIGIASAEIFGDITGTIAMELADTTDGRVYMDEFSAAFSANPYSIFNATGSITAGLSVVIDSIFGEIWNWGSPRVTLGDFGFGDGVPAPDPQLAVRSGSVLTLNVGATATNRAFHATPFDISELISVSATTNVDELQLAILGHSERFAGITLINAQTGDGNDAVLIAPDFDISFDVSGQLGNDALSGAAMGDSLNGNQGNDSLMGEGGNDGLYGGLGNDLLVGALGADTLDGGDGDDQATYYESVQAVDIDLARASQFGGTAQGDRLIGIEDIFGSDQNDSIVGSLAEGSFTGMQGDDVLRSGSHVQALFGNDGNDRLQGGANDTLIGGNGDDVYVVNAVTTWVNDNGLGEIDTLSGADSGYDWVQGNADINLATSGDQHIERISLYGTADEARANGRNNLIEGNVTRADTLFGVEGNDSIHGNGGGDVLYGGLGGDAIFGEAGRDTVLGQQDNDLAYGGLDGDDLSGGDGNDTLFGEEANDTLRGDAGVDSMTGGVANDYFEATTGDAVVEASAGGTDFVFARETFVLQAGQNVEILSLLGLEDHDWDRVFDDGDPQTRAQVFYAAGLLLGAPADQSGADLTGNEIRQLLIANLNGLEFGEVNHLEGMAGADTLVGDGLRDWAVYTQSGAAVAINLSAAVQLGGHAFGDVLFGIRNVLGSAFNDILLGENADDVLYPDLEPFAGYSNELDGAGGDDLISGLEGHDTLRGGAGNDTLLGGLHDDVVYGSLGNDSVEGGDGQDTLRGGEGNDLVSGADGGGVVHGDEGNDTLTGGSGADSLYGGTGNDSMDGGDGNDLFVVDAAGDVVVDAGGTNDSLQTGIDYILSDLLRIEHLLAQAGSVGISLHGNRFAQIITGNAGSDYLHGGDGADTIYGGGGGPDTASYLLSDAGVDVDLNRTIQSGGDAEGDQLFLIHDLQGSAFDDVLIGRNSTLSGASPDNLHRGEGGADFIEDAVGENTLYGGSGRDTLIGSGGSPLVAGHGSVLYGGNGNDSLDGGRSTATGGDTLAGGLGDDTYRVTSVGDVVDENFGGDIALGQDGGLDTLISDVTIWSMTTAGQAGIENGLLGLGLELTGNTLSNSLTGNTLDNRLVGGDGNDTLLGSSGRDTLIGGNGSDSLVGGTGIDQMSGGSNDDIFVVNDTGDVATDNLNAGSDTVRASVSYTLSSNIENLVLTGLSAIDGTGNALNNRLTGNAAANRLDGTTGADTMEAGGGNDTYVTDGGDTIIEASAGGHDVVESSVTYKLGAFLEDLVLTGTVNRNGTGNGLDNVLTGNSGANRLNGGAGADTLIGGRGNDLYIVDGSDIVVELAGQGVDRVESAVSHVLAAQVENLTLTGGGMIDGTGNGAANVITGNGSANVLRGQAGADTIDGAGGSDVLQGGEDADSLTGGEGNDTLQGGNGNDRLLGGAGKDELTGGGDSDVIVFLAMTDTTSNATTCDVITGFVQGQDKIDLSAIDANPLLQGDNAFAFRPQLGFDIGGDVSVLQVDNVGTTDDYTLVNIDTDATPAAEAVIRLTGLYTLTTLDFVL